MKDKIEITSVEKENRSKTGYIQPPEDENIASNGIENESVNDIITKANQDIIDATIGDGIEFCGTIVSAKDMGIDTTSDIVSGCVSNANRSTVFQSKLVVKEYPTDKIEIIVPPNILHVCNELQSRVGSNEFSIVCKGGLDSKGNYIVEDEYEVPRQKVGGASVDYDNEHLAELKELGYRTVIHSHPFNSKTSNFSHDDRKTINTHFDCSILFSCHTFTYAVVSFAIKPGLKVVLDASPQVGSTQTPGLVPDDQFKNIDMKSKTYYGKNYDNNYYRRNYYDNYYNRYYDYNNLDRDYKDGKFGNDHIPRDYRRGASHSNGFGENIRGTARECAVVIPANSHMGNGGNGHLDHNLGSRNIPNPKSRVFTGSGCKCGKKDNNDKKVFSKSGKHANSGKKGIAKK